MIWNKLPHCDKLFREFLSPWYPKNERPKKTRPDMYQIAGYKGETLDMDRIQYLTDEWLNEAKQIMQSMREAYILDYKEIVNFEKFDIDVIDKIDKSYDKKEVLEIIRNSNPKDFENLYLVSICEFGIALGDLFVETGRFEWLYSAPYFHSIVVNPETGVSITVFDWAVKKFSSYGLNNGVKDKFFRAMEYIEDDIDKIKNAG